MHFFRTGIIPNCLSILLALGTFVGGGLGPSLHDMLHHAEKERPNAGHCSHSEHETAFESHHSSMDRSQCVFHQRTTSTLRPTNMAVVPPDGTRSHVIPSVSVLVGNAQADGLWVRGPPGTA